MNEYVALKIFAAKIKRIASEILTDDWTIYKCAIFLVLIKCVTESVKLSINTMHHRNNKFLEIFIDIEQLNRKLEDQCQPSCGLVACVLYSSVLVRMHVCMYVCHVSILFIFIRFYFLLIHSP